MTQEKEPHLHDTSSTNDPLPTGSSTSEHVLKLSQGQLSYRATADWITLRKIHKPVAQIFHTAYFVQTDSGQRPLTFVFNGGPGAASAYLHMGAMGPQRVAFGSMGTVPPLPVRVVPNNECWLSFTDLVFIDPVGTGFSRAIQEESDPIKEKINNEGPVEKKDYWEIEKDLDSLGEFISRFLSKHHRWTSPLFIAGESYGGFRVAKMARRLQEKHGIGVCGALLISPAIEFNSLVGSDYDLTYWIELFPSMAATAYHHGLTRNIQDKTPLSAVIEQAESFARNQLARWLAYGDSLSKDEKSQILLTMSDLLGLSQSLLEQAGGRIRATPFCRELLRKERLLCGHYDASLTTVDPFPDRSEYEGPDPTLYSIERLFTGAINHHLRAHLKVQSELDYRLLSMKVNEAWKDNRKRHFYGETLGAMDDLRYGMSLNAYMKVFIAHGYFDLVTPYFSSHRLTQLMKLTENQQRNLIKQNFRGGHMFYSWDESRVEFHEAAQRFYQSVSEEQSF